MCSLRTGEKKMKQKGEEGEKEKESRLDKIERVPVTCGL